MNARPIVQCGVERWDHRLQEALVEVMAGGQMPSMHGAMDWSLCACGQMTPLIPRSSGGGNKQMNAPLDPELHALGCDFGHLLCRSNTDILAVEVDVEPGVRLRDADDSRLSDEERILLAMACLARIEERAAQVQTESVAKLPKSDRVQHVMGATGCAREVAEAWLQERGL